MAKNNGADDIDERAAILAAAVNGLMVGMDYVPIKDLLVTEALVKIAKGVAS